MPLPDYHGGSTINLMASLQTGLDGPAHTYAPLHLLPAETVAGPGPALGHRRAGTQLPARASARRLLQQPPAGRHHLGVPAHHSHRDHHLPYRRRATAARPDRMAYVFPGAGQRAGRVARQSPLWRRGSRRSRHRRRRPVRPCAVFGTYRRRRLQRRSRLHCRFGFQPLPPGTRTRP